MATHKENPIQFRRYARGTTVVPFSTKQPTNQKLLEKWKLCLSQSGARILKGRMLLPTPLDFKKSVWKTNHLEKIYQTAAKRHARNFEQAKRQTQQAIIDLFSFLGEVEFPAKMDLLEKFNQGIAKKEIRTIKQMEHFLKKAEELANCIYLFLEKNEYSENFSIEMSYEMFEKGFSTKEQTEFTQLYNDYFSKLNVDSPEAK